MSQQFQGNLYVHFQPVTNHEPFPDPSVSNCEDTYPKYPESQPKEQKMTPSPTKHYYSAFFWIFLLLILIGGGLYVYGGR